MARCANYIHAVSQEAELRNKEHVLNVGSYMSLRRENSAVQVCFGLFEYVHGIDLPNEVFEDPVFMRLYWQGIDMVCLSNVSLIWFTMPLPNDRTIRLIIFLLKDLYSYSMERAKGLDGNNFITVAMQDKGLKLQDAADYVGQEFKARLDQFLRDEKLVPTFGKSVDEDVQKYVFSISQWCIGNLIWSFETPRYFGNEHDEVKNTLVVKVKSRGEEVDTEIRTR